MSREEDKFQRYATEYDPVKIGSIDGTDTIPHDRAILFALDSEYVPNKSVRGDARHTIFVARLHPRTTQETLISEFSDCGKIVRCRLVKDIVTGKSKQYAFIEFERSADVDRALQKHKEYIDNTEVVVEREVERVMKGWKPRRLGGGFGGNKDSGQLRFGCRDRPFKRPIKVRDDIRD
ncbi:U11/U12 small nuclear ribonucleoprotein 35 kDa protein-like [Leguminivora glycinivorella]|uniref:U11/U12 small nuclear ribonucleoprotein 35 kDa protein-like n=1 Tax=Leguminivora glycinivorella TaxID=1035111 RepID=UPI00200BDB8A|nr:U11/U12 small nuclear ribonucleoprotein 35 kDa protein-like [Leguminivora glycinivorella]